jgi:nicotinamide riboside kinase
LVRVAFVGAHSTGKTTLLEHCKARLGGDLRVIEDVPRSVISRGFPLAQYATVDSFVNYIKDQLQAERMLAKTDCALLISNRTVCDAVGYAMANRELPRPAVPQYFIDMLEEVARREAEYYDLFINFPVEFAVVADGIRPTDESYRSAVADAISAFVRTLGVSIIDVRGATEDRFEQFMTGVSRARPTHGRAE